MKTKILILFSALLLSVLSFGQNNIFQSEKVTKIWEVIGLQTPESALLVPDKQMMFVSNIGPKTELEKDTKGFIALVTLDGTLKELNWVNGLNAPKGMALLGDKLYVADIDNLVEIDVKQAKISNTFPVEGAKFLNDVTVSPEGIIYFTDSQTKKVHKFQSGKVSLVLQNNDWGFINGIICLDGSLVVGVGDKVVKIDPSTKIVTDFLMNTGGVDGLVNASPDVFLFSDWSGKTHVMKIGKEKELLLDTSMTENIKSADFAFLTDQKLIYIPTFFGNSVVCYQLILDEK